MRGYMVLKVNICQLKLRWRKLIFFIFCKIIRNTVYINDLGRFQRFKLQPPLQSIHTIHARKMELRQNARKQPKTAVKYPNIQKCPRKGVKSMFSTDLISTAPIKVK